MKTRLVLSFIVIVLASGLIFAIQRNSAVQNAQAALLSATNSNEAYLQSQQTAGLAVASIALIAVITLIAVWAKTVVEFLRNKGKYTLLLLLILPSTLLAACGGESNKKVVTKPNEVTFMIQLNGDNTNQAVVNGTPLTGDADFWKKNLVNLREVEITQYCYKKNANATTNCDYRDAVLVVTVDTSSVNIQWVAPAIIQGQPFPDMSNAFSMQSLEANGGSTGVYVGAQLIAHIAPKDAALYLASYGYQDKVEPGVYPARSLQSVLSTEVRAQIQTDLNAEYGSRSVAEQNRDMAKMFEIVKNDLIKIFGAKGITIDSFGFRDGNVYENAAIQQGIDSSFDRQKQLQEAKDNAIRQAIVDKQLIDSALAQATATTVAAESEAKAHQLQAQVLDTNPNALQQQWIDKWNGQLPAIVGESNAVPMVPFQLTPVSAATATPNP